MIVGIGFDSIDINRIQASLDRFGLRFEQRIFTDHERAKARRRAGSPRGLASTYAKRFAAKEACAKALGTGFNQGVFMRDIGVVNLVSGQPTLELLRGAARRLEALMPAGHTPALHLTLTDDFPWAFAQVIIEAKPA